MKITQVKLGRISTPLRVPFKTALRTVRSVEDVIVELHTDTGAVGYGEAPPTGVITGDTTGAIIGAIRDHIAPAILGRDLDEFEDLTAAVQKALVHNTSAKAAVDMALWDLLGQKYGAPVYRMLGGARSNIVTDITISVNPPEEMARDARTALERGYDCLKVKVGIDPELDVARLAAVREAVGKRSGSASTPIRRGMRSRPSASSTRCRKRALTSSSSSSLCLPLTSRGCSTSPGTPACLCWPTRACSAPQMPCASCRPARRTL